MACSKRGEGKHCTNHGVESSWDDEVGVRNREKGVGGVAVSAF
jgi:hypothetical protein